MDSHDSRRIAIVLAQRVSEGARPEEIALSIVSTWEQIEVTLRPILGQTGIATLYRRSLYLTKADYPWMSGLAEGLPEALELRGLQSVVSLQNSVMAAAAGGALFQTFYELLSSLIGPSLTERLLRPVWANC